MATSDGLALLLTIKANADQARREIASLRSSVASETVQMKTGFSGAETASTSFGSSIGSTALKVAGIGAVITTAVTGLFAFATKATQAAADLKDLSDQTGIQVETLSTLSNIAETTGGSIGTISNSLVIFQKNQVAAEQGNKKLSATFQALNIDTKDNEKGLRDAFAALGKMEAGSQQTALAMQLFGRSGKEVLAIIRDTGGNLDQATEKFRGLNTLITTDMANAADEFHDQMTGAGQQAAALGRDVALGLLPILQSLVGMLDWLVIGFKALGSAISWVKEQMGGSWVNNALMLVMNRTAGAVVPGMGLAMLGRKSGEEAKGTAGPVVGSGGGRGGGGRGGQDKTEQNALKASQLAEKEDLTWVTYYLSELKRLRDSEEIDLEAYARRSIELARAKLVAIWNSTERELVALRASKKNQEEVALEEREIHLRRNAAWHEFDDERYRLTKERDDKILELRKEYVKKLEEIGELEEDINERRIKLEDESLRRELQLVEGLYAAQKKYEQQDRDAQRRALDLAEQMGASRVQILAERARLDLEEEDARHQGLNSELVVQEASLKALATTEAKKLEIERQFNALREQEKQRHEEARTGIVSAADTDAVLGGAANGNPWAAVIQNFTDNASVVQGLAGMITESFNMMGQAVAKALDSFIKFGTAGGSLRKFAVEMISTLAQMAAVQAIYQLAQGLAWLALNFFFPNPKYVLAANTAFASAAVFGSIAGVATVAGRALAGNGYAGGAGGGTSTDTGANTRNERTNATTAPQSIDAGRRTSEPIRVIVEVKPTEAFVVKSFVNDWSENGRTRATVMSGNK